MVHTQDRCADCRGCELEGERPGWLGAGFGQKKTREFGQAGELHLYNEMAFIGDRKPLKQVAGLTVRGQ